MIESIFNTAIPIGSFVSAVGMVVMALWANHTVAQSVEDTPETAVPHHEDGTLND